MLLVRKKVIGMINGCFDSTCMQAAYVQPGFIIMVVLNSSQVQSYQLSHLNSGIRADNRWHLFIDKPAKFVFGMMPIIAHNE